MQERDGDHWLWRLGAAEWLDAAARELELGEAARGVRRTAVTHARRAAGMALNAVLVELVARGGSPGRSETLWGRSYVEHLRTLADRHLDPGLREPFDAEFGLRCAELLAISPMAPTGLVSLARTRDEAATNALALARRIVEGCAAWIVPATTIQ